MQREAVESLTARKLAMTTGFWANDGMNDEKNTRANALEKLEEQFNEAVELIYAGPQGLAEREDEHRFTEEDEKNPFLLPAIQATRAIETPRDDEGTVQQVIESETGTDFSTDQDE